MKLALYDYGCLYLERLGDWLGHPFHLAARWCYRRWVTENDRRNAEDVQATRETGA